MLTPATDRAGRKILIFGNQLPSLPPPERGAEQDWMQARPAAIRKTLERVSALPSGGWYVLDASRRIGAQPRGFRVADQELVAWRVDGELRVAPNSCPHMGAPLSAGRATAEGTLVCPWHGLELGSKRHGKWAPLVGHDDGVLSWVRLGDGPDLTEAPILPPRPDRFIDGVIRMTARCEPGDVIANRLDPWHGAWFHFHSFARLRVIEERDDVLTVRVAFRVAGPMCVEVDCTFHCPEPRTIVMTIVGGEGIGSVVETHATPMAPGRTAIVEATLANSDRPGFQAVRRLTPLLRPMVERTARRLWVEDAAYAERTYFLREGRPADGDWSEIPGTPRPR